MSARAVARVAALPEIERRLREWGLACGARLATEQEPAAETPLHRATVERARTRYVRSEGQQRGYLPTSVQKRALAASGAVPAWAGWGAVVCSETRVPAGRAPSGSYMPAPILAVEDAVLALQRWDPRAALALRACYCLLGRRPLSERIEWAATKAGQPLSRMNYRAALARGRIAVAGALKLPPP